MDNNRTLTDKFMLRLPDGMRARIKAAADLRKRSMNSEIIATLEVAYPDPVFDWAAHIKAYQNADAEIMAELDEALDRLSRANAEEKREKVSAEIREIQARHAEIKEKFSRHP